MATTKKAAVKKPAARKAPVVKKAVAKAPVTKKTAARKSANSAASMQSFRVYREPAPFTTFKITRQTVYWILLVSFIIFVQLWIIKLQIEVANLVDQQQNNSLISQ